MTAGAPRDRGHRWIGGAIGTTGSRSSRPSSRSVFAIVSAALAGVILNTTQLTRTDRARVVAASLATRELEVVREEAGRLPVVRLEQGGTTSTRTVGETTYTIRRAATWTTTTADRDSCTTNAGATGNAYLRVTVDVTWPRMGETSPVRADTLLTPALGTFSTASGNISVKVTDSDGRGGAAHVVSAEKEGTRLTQTTTAEGCAFFAFVEPGTYTISLGSPGYVDPTGNATPTQTATVTAAAPTASAVSFVYDREVPVTFVDADPAFPLATATTETMTVGNDGYQPSGKLPISFAGSPFAAVLFPWRDGVGVWAGACADAKPQTPPRLTLTPGAPFTARVPAARVEVAVTRGGTPAVNVPVAATHSADSSCTPGETRTLGRTGADGRVRASLPYGSWTVSAGGSGTDITLSAATDGPTSVTVAAP